MSQGRDSVFRVHIVIEPDEDGFHAYCPGLEGVHTCGETEHEALRNAADAATAYIKSCLKHGDPLPLGTVFDTTPSNPRLLRSSDIGPTQHYKELVVAGS
ncbi:MAG: type II toxin-antitoxin system HicB family antitoxin [Dehalococcoidia bacterium]|nr:type II toxin-antitoxin system HicB family antitoxin [Dehalococcoidia bacterium]